MDDVEAVPPKPGFRMLRTWLALPRSVRRLYRDTPLDQLCPQRPSLEEAAHWGRIEILDERVVMLHRDGTVTFRTRYVAMLHGDQDLKEWEETGVVYRRRLRRPKIVRSVLHLPDGKRRKVTVRDTVFDRAGTRMQVATHTHLRPGVIIDHVAHDDHFRPHEAAPGVWGEFFLHTRWPCLHRRLCIAVARPFELHYRALHGAPEPVRETIDGYAVYTWELHDTPGAELDAWTPPAVDCSPWVDYSTLPGWKAVADYYRKEIDPDCVKGHIDHAQVKAIIGDATADREKLERVYRFAAEGVRYGRPQREMEERRIRSGSRIAEDMQGDCKDKSALIVSMLRQVNVPADLAVLLSRQHGSQPLLPSPRFDHAIAVAQVDGREIWLDAAGGRFGLGVIPYHDQGAYALILGRNGRVAYRQVPPAQPADHSVERHLTGRLDEEGNYRYELTVHYTGERAADMRQRLADRNTESRRRMLQQAEGEVVLGAHVEDVEVSGLDDLAEDRLTVTYRVVLPAVGRRVRDLMLLRLPWAEQLALVGPLASTTRDVPLLSPLAQRRSERQEIALPEGHTAYALPFEHRECNQWMSYQLRIEQVDGRLIATRQVEYAAGPQLISPEEYPAFRAAWGRCARADVTDIVLYSADAALG